MKKLAIILFTVLLLLESAPNVFAEEETNKTIPIEFDDSFVVQGVLDRVCDEILKEGDDFITKEGLLKGLKHVEEMNRISHDCSDRIHKMIEAAYCPRCGSFSFSTVPGYYEIIDSCSDFCSHGYANGVDIGYKRIYHGAYRHCANCNYSTDQSVSAPEWVTECHGFN